MANNACNNSVYMSTDFGHVSRPPLIGCFRILLCVPSGVSMALLLDSTGILLYRPRLYNSSMVCREYIICDLFGIFRLNICIHYRVNTLRLIKRIGYESKALDRNRFLSLLIGSLLLSFFAVIMVIQFILPQYRSLCFAIAAGVVFITLLVVVIYFLTYGRHYIATVKKSKQHKYLVKMVMDIVFLILD